METGKLAAFQQGFGSYFGQTASEGNTVDPLNMAAIADGRCYPGISCSKKSESFSVITKMATLTDGIF